MLPDAGKLGSIPGQELDPTLPRLRVHMLPLNIPSAAAETQQPNKCIKNKYNFKFLTTGLWKLRRWAQKVSGAGVQDRWERSRDTGWEVSSQSTSSPEAFLKAAEWTSYGVISSPPGPKGYSEA